MFLPVLLLCKGTAQCTATVPIASLETSWLYVLPAAKWNAKKPRRRPLLAGGSHQASVWGRGAVLPGQPADSLHRVPQGGQWQSHMWASPSSPGGNLCTQVGEAGQACSPIWEQMCGASWHLILWKCSVTDVGRLLPSSFILWGCCSVGSALT